MTLTRKAPAVVLAASAPFAELDEAGKDAENAIPGDADDDGK
jgi:hypothetical protein